MAQCPLVMSHLQVVALSAVSSTQGAERKEEWCAICEFKSSFASEHGVVWIVLTARGQRTTCAISLLPLFALCSGGRAQQWYQRLALGWRGAVVAGCQLGEHLVLQRQPNFAPQ